MTQDEQEALSHKYTGLWLVPLDSGRIAIFTHPLRELETVVNSWEDVKMWRLARIEKDKNYFNSLSADYLLPDLVLPLLDLKLDFS